MSRLFVTSMDCTVHAILQARILDWGAFPFSGDIPNPEIEPRSPALQEDSLQAEPQGKPGIKWSKVQIYSEEGKTQEIETECQGISLQAN